EYVAPDDCGDAAPVAFRQSRCAAIGQLNSDAAHEQLGGGERRVVIANPCNGLPTPSIPPFTSNIPSGTCEFRAKGNADVCKLRSPGQLRVGEERDWKKGSRARRICQAFGGGCVELTRVDQGRFLLGGIGNAGLARHSGWLALHHKLDQELSAEEEHRRGGMTIAKGRAGSTGWQEGRALCLGKVEAVGSHSEVKGVIFEEWIGVVHVGCGLTVGDDKQAIGGRRKTEEEGGDHLCSAATGRLKTISSTLSPIPPPPDPQPSDHHEFECRSKLSVEIQALLDPATDSRPSPPGTFTTLPTERSQTLPQLPPHRRSLPRLRRSTSSGKTRTTANRASSSMTSRSATSLTSISRASQGSSPKFKSPPIVAGSEMGAPSPSTLVDLSQASSPPPIFALGGDSALQLERTITAKILEYRHNLDQPTVSVLDVIAFTVLAIPSKAPSIQAFLESNLPALPNVYMLNMHQRFFQLSFKAFQPKGRKPASRTAKCEMQRRHEIEKPHIDHELALTQIEEREAMESAMRVEYELREAADEAAHRRVMEQGNLELEIIFYLWAWEERVALEGAGRIKVETAEGVIAQGSSSSVPARRRRKRRLMPHTFFSAIIQHAATIASWRFSPREYEVPDRSDKRRKEREAGSLSPAAGRGGGGGGPNSTQEEVPTLRDSAIGGLTQFPVRAMLQTALVPALPPRNQGKTIAATYRLAMYAPLNVGLLRAREVAGILPHAVRHPPRHAYFGVYEVAAAISTLVRRVNAALLAVIVAMFAAFFCGHEPSVAQASNGGYLFLLQEWAAETHSIQLFFAAKDFPARYGRSVRRVKQLLGSTAAGFHGTDGMRAQYLAKESQKRAKTSEDATWVGERGSQSVLSRIGPRMRQTDLRGGGTAARVPSPLPPPRPFYMSLYCCISSISPQKVGSLVFAVFLEQ
ncbi:hypothetical protein BDK51DRAFT_35163, partial [Blyttiomyces helicus]